MSSSSAQRDAAETLIRIIREQHGYDDAHSTPSPAVSGLREILERALVRLSSDLYNKKTHFLLEFIQNADDNAYGDDVTPSLKLTIEQNLIVFECNELGFSADNVRAICDIGASTKTHENSTRGFIGMFSGSPPVLPLLITPYYRREGHRLQVGLHRCQRSAHLLGTVFVLLQPHSTAGHDHARLGLRLPSHTRLDHVSLAPCAFRERHRP